MCDIAQKLEGLCLDPKEFFANSEPSEVHHQVMEEIRRESSQRFVDPYQVQADQDWSFLADKVVGAELLGGMTE